MSSSPRRLRTGCRALLCLLPTLVLAASAGAQEWTRFRGPNGSGIGPVAANLPARFTPADYNWRIALPGGGHSSPVLWGKKIFLTAAEEDKNKRHLLCVNAADGKTLWSQGYEYKPYRTHEFNTAASTTPVVDSQRVYVVWPAPDSFLVVALTHGGKEVWRRDMGKYPSSFGGAASPIVHNGLLLFGMEPEEGEGGLFALDCATGATRWKWTRGSRGSAYSAPFLYQPPSAGAAAVVPQVIFSSTGRGITSLDPATGQLNWEAGDLFRARCVLSPIQVGSLIFAGAGNGGGDREAVALRPGANSAKPEIAYRMTRGAPYVPTPVAVGSHLFLWGDNGIVTCANATTGETIWQERAGGNYFGSPICAGGKLWAMNTKGELVVLEASATFKLLARNDLGEMSHATPAVADGVMYLRTRSHLISLGGTKKKPSPRTAISGAH